MPGQLVYKIERNKPMAMDRGEVAEMAEIEGNLK